VIHQTLRGHYPVQLLLVASDEMTSI
jgi:hypothetical protein